MNGKVGGKLDRLFLQDLAEIQVEQPQKGHDYQDDYQECTKIEMFDGRTCKVRFGNAVLGPLSRKLGTPVPRSSSTTGCWSSSTTGWWWWRLVALSAKRSTGRSGFWFFVSFFPRLFLFLLTFLLVFWNSVYLEPDGLFRLVSVGAVQSHCLRRFHFRCLLLHLQYCFWFFLVF